MSFKRKSTVYTGEDSSASPAKPEGRSMMKKVGIDCRFAGSNTGLGRYTRELVTHLLKRDDDIQYTLFVRSGGEPWLKGVSNARMIKTDIPHYSFEEQTRLPRLLVMSKIDLFFSPHFNVPYACPIPFIVTIHDLILHRYPNNASKLKQYVYKFLMKRSVTKAKDIIAVSKFTAKELADEYGNNIAAKTTVIREGVNKKFVPASEEEKKLVMKKHNIKSPFFLYVGNAKEHKNVPLLLSAFAGLNSNMELVLATGGLEADELKLPSGVIRISSLPEADLIALYSAATAFVTASAYEGFCLPIAEAQACGCKVIASNTSAIPEVAGKNVKLVDPTVEAFKNAMLKVDSIKSSEPIRLKWDGVAESVVEIF